MFAIRKMAAAPGLTWVEDQPLPEIGPGEVLIAVTHAGICGTDKHIYEWDEWAQGRVRPPVTVGHEFVGRVVEVGSIVQRVKPGQRVSGEGHIGCGECEPCRTGRAHICERVEVIGIERDGTFAQYLVLPQDNVWIVDSAIPDSVAAIMDPLGNAMHTVMTADVSGKTVLVTGAGVIGLMAIAIAKLAGARQVLAVDIEPRHLELAAGMGADHLLDGRDGDWWQLARALTPKRQGPEVWLEMSGSAPAIDAGFKALRNGGTVALLGLPRAPVTIDIGAHIIFKGATVLGISGRRMYETWYQMEGFLSGAGLAIESLVTNRFPVDRFEDAFAVLGTGEAVKVILEFPSVEGPHE
jgi:threonine 3-dehydrogenase